MSRLLENGNILTLVLVKDPETGLMGDREVEISPDNPEYEKYLLFLSPNDRNRARALYADTSLAPG